MPGIARQFEPQITRTGGAPSKYRFTARCSECRSNSKAVGTSRVVPVAAAGHRAARGQAAEGHTQSRRPDAGATQQRPAA